MRAVLVSAVLAFAALATASPALLKRDNAVFVCDSTQYELCCKNTVASDGEVTRCTFAETVDLVDAEKASSCELIDEPSVYINAYCCEDYENSAAVPGGGKGSVCVAPEIKTGTLA